MPRFACFNVVKIVRLNELDRPYEGAEHVGRPPRVGDIGTIVGEVGRDVVQVECVNAERELVWQAEFHVSEYESIHGEPVEWNELPSDAFRIAHAVKVGMSRQDVIALLGEPNDTGPTSRKYRTPAILKYGDVELHFDPPSDGTLRRVYMEDTNGLGINLLE